MDTGILIKVYKDYNDIEVLKEAVQKEVVPNKLIPIVCNLRMLRNKSVHDIENDII
jgi:hypothetical protein